MSKLWILSAVFVLLILFVASCSPDKVTPATEEAKVVDLVYNPGGHGSGPSVDMKGNVGVSMITISPKYAVVFECKHGKFIVEGEGSRHKALWSKLHAGDIVTVRYNELWKKNGDTYVVYDYDFIDAIPKEVTQ